MASLMQSGDARTFYDVSRTSGRFGSILTSSGHTFTLSHRREREGRVGVTGTASALDCKWGKVRREGLEPPTHALEGHCSIQLSYRRIDVLKIVIRNYRYPQYEAATLCLKLLFTTRLRASTTIEGYFRMRQNIKNGCH